MSESQEITTTRVGQSKRTIAPETEIILNLIPWAAAIVDSKSMRVLVANQRLGKLSSYPLNQLVNLELRDLFTTWDAILFFSGPNRPDGPDAPTLDLLSKDRRKTSVHLGIQPLDAMSLRYLILIESERDRVNVDEISSDLFIEWIEAVGDIRKFDLISGLSNFFDASNRYIGASSITIYTASESHPELIRLVNLGENAALPETLPAQELSRREQFSLWTNNRQATTKLQSLARNIGATYIYVARLGQDKARIGLLVILGMDADPPQFLGKVGQALANITTALLEHFLHLHDIDRDIAQLRRNSKRNKVLLDATIQGAIILSPAMRVIEINAPAEKILGYSKKEVENQPVHHVLIGSESLLEQLASLSEGFQQIYSADLQLFRRSGEIFLGRLLAIPVYMDNHIESVVILVQDLTELEQIREQTRQLEQRAILGEITSVFAHEVRNPINNLSTGLELLSLQLSPEDPNRDTVNRLVQDCDRLTELMKSVLTYSKPMDYSMVAIPLGPLLQSILERSRMRIDLANIHHHLLVQPGCPPVRGSKRPLEQVFTNLINNAIQAMADTGGILTVRVELIDQNNNQPANESRQLVQVSVIDTGPGIPQAEQEKIFQPFFTTRQSGTGLGLAITRNIVNSHHGTIKLSSFPGGTVFQVVLPIA
jgi:two-component system, NtrC family, sensor histidine kinase AtoS